MNYKTPFGRLYKLYTDALAQPHLLIAGATGSGKSVVENGLIYQLLLQAPADISGGVQLILIDPKRVELCQYKRLPHVLRYASEPDTMLSAISYAMEITERRYKSMQRTGARKYPGGAVYVFIDEFADLMTTQGKAVKPLIQRLAQIGRAANVHIILCTQCPLRTVIPTEIKVNFDARFALRTRSAQDSRNIIEQTGCELLPRYGWAYYMTPATAGPVLYHDIPFIPDTDINRRIAWWMNQTGFRRLLRFLRKPA